MARARRRNIGFSCKKGKVRALTCVQVLLFDDWIRRGAVGLSAWWIGRRRRLLPILALVQGAACAQSRQLVGRDSHGLQLDQFIKRGLDTGVFNSPHIFWRD